jgi:hypothetical protein
VMHNEKMWLKLFGTHVLIFQIRLKIMWKLDKTWNCFATALLFICT